MPRLVFGSAPLRVVVRLGRASVLGTGRTDAAACVWSRRLTRPKRLRLATRAIGQTARSIQPQSGSIHGRRIYA